MRVLILSDSWPEERGTVAPVEVAAIAGRTWADANGADTVVSLGIGDGGPRSADALGDDIIQVGAIEAVIASGRWVLRPPGGTTRWEPADLGAALDIIATHPEREGATVVVPVGDSDVAGDATAVWGASLASAQSRWKALPLEVLVTSQRPLLGLKGMSSSIRDGRENDHALAVAAQEQERRWSDVARMADAAQPAQLIGPARLSDTPGSGAASGLAYCLAAAGAKLTPASARLTQFAGADHVAPDLVVAVTSSLTPHTLDEGVTHAAATVAASHAAPCAVLAVDVWVGKRDLMAAGVSAAHEGTPGSEALAIHLTRVAQTWSPAT